MKDTTGTQFHMMAKPIGSICNLRCSYCYYLSKKDFFPNQGKNFMSDSTLETFIQQYIAAQNAGQIHFAWQGGEPTLLGLEYFRKILNLQQKHCPPDKQISNDLQTNGTLLDDKWCEFLHENNFLVGLSIDGPKPLHDYYRRDKNNNSTFDKVVAAANLLRKHKVEFNTLTLVNRLNVQKPLEVYRFLRDELPSQYLQFIPCVEPKEFAQVAPQYWDSIRFPEFDSPSARPGSAGSFVTDSSVDPVDYGNFLCEIFDEWIKNDVGKIFVLLFDAALGAWLGRQASLCCFSQVCGKAMVIEHDGSVYACDHYVYPEYRLGNIHDQPLAQIALLDRQVEFGLSKTTKLPQYCRECKYLFACNGECPKNRFILTPDGAPGLNYLCKGLRNYFSHIDPWMKLMAHELRSGRPAQNVMKAANMPSLHTPTRSKKIRLNAPCPCGSGRKYKKCCKLHNP